jgi:MraZ protein
MFRGQYLYSIDSKKRLSIPAKLRKNLLPEANESFVITQGFGKCIDLYPMDEWQEIEKRLNQLNEYDVEQMKLRRMILHTAVDVEMDNQARIILPQHLLEFSGIENEVLIIGNLRKMELWNPQIFKEYLNVSAEAYEQLAAKVMMGK